MSLLAGAAVGGPIGGLISRDDGGSEYGPTPQTHEYTTVTGLLAVPRCVGPPKVVRLHQEYGTRVSSWESHRANRAPRIPRVTCRSDIYLGGTITAALPQQDPTTGSYNHMASGSYFYLQDVTRSYSDPRQATNREPGVDAIPTGVYPYELSIQDYHAAQILMNTPPDSNATVDNYQTLLGATIEEGGLVDLYSAYSWPFTWLPPAESSHQFH